MFNYFAKVNEISKSQRNNFYMSKILPKDDSKHLRKKTAGLLLRLLIVFGKVI